MAYSLDDILGLPTDPNELREHLENTGALAPPPPPPVATTVPELNRPMVPSATPALKPFNAPTNMHPHLPAMHSSELPEAPTMASSPIMPPESSKLVQPMSAPNVSAPMPSGVEGGLPFTSEMGSTTPIATPQVGTVPYYQSELNRAAGEARGDKIGDHPSFLGKVGHVLGRIGNAAGNIFVPGAMQDIPGTDMYKQQQVREAEKNLAGEQERESTEKYRTAQTAEAEARAKKEGEAGHHGIITDESGQAVGWSDEHGEPHTLDEPGTPPALKKIAENWKGKKAADKEEEWTELKDFSGPNGEPMEIEKHSGQVRVAGADTGAKKTPKESKESEEDKAISDYLQGHKLEDTPANRDRVRSILKTRDRKATDPEVAELSKDIKKAQLEKMKEPTPDEQRRADLGENMLENLSELEGIVQRRPDLFGPGAGRLTSARAWLGTGDQDIARLKAIHEYLGMASVGAHAMRNAQHVSTAADAVMNAFNNKPEATLAAIGQARKSVNTFLKDATRRRTAIEGAIGGEGGGSNEGGGPPGPPAAGMVWKRNKRTGEYKQFPE